MCRDHFCGVHLRTLEFFLRARSSVDIFSGKNEGAGLQVYDEKLDYIFSGKNEGASVYVFTQSQSNFISLLSPSLPKIRYTKKSINYITTTTNTAVRHSPS